MKNALIIDSVSELEGKSFGASARPQFHRVLMVDPQYFKIEYAINEFMKDASGKIHSVDTELARKQWQSLKATLQDLGTEVEVLPGQPGFPDMVFAANQSFPFWNQKTGKPGVFSSRMRHPERQGEVPYFDKWYSQKGYEVLGLESKVYFEGNGDALWHPGLSLVWGGYGHRTDKELYEELSNRLGVSVIRLDLVTKEFYHLDTCFSILNAQTVAYYPGAFSTEGVKLIQTLFKNNIEIGLEECQRFFSGNCFSPNGKDVILQRGAVGFERKLVELGFRVHPIDTSEFIKAGGSVFCLKCEIF